MKILILDFFNILKRYTCFVDMEKASFEEIIDNLNYKLLNRFGNIIDEVKPDIVYFCGDSGSNIRAKSIIKEYKANRKKVSTGKKEKNETDFIEYFKQVLDTLPIIYLDVDHVEADMIIRCLVNYLTRLKPETEIVIATSDSDMIQLLNTNISIYDWKKGYITPNNWYTKSKISDEFYINHKNYALFKSIIGDKSDNIEGLKGIGWKTLLKMMMVINKEYDPFNVYYTDIESLIEILSKLDKSKLDKIENKLVNKLISMFNENISLIRRNLSVIDLSALETSFVFNIYSLIERKMYDQKIKFDMHELIKHLVLNRFSTSDFEYAEILKKNKKACIPFYILLRKSIIALDQFKEKRNFLKRKYK